MYRLFAVRCALLATGVMCLGVDSLQSVPDEKPASKAVSNPQVAALLETHCAACHGPQKQEGQLKLSALDPDITQGLDAEHWQEVLDRLNAGTMPPKGKSKLTAQEREQVVGWLTEQLKLAAEARRSTGGRTVLRRLTRYEYSNTLRDLLGVELDYAKDLPPESTAELGFQNNSKVLVTSRLHLETYQKIAKRALVEAFGAKDKPVPVELTMEPREKAPAPKNAKKLGNLRASIAANKDGTLKFAKVPDAGPVMIRITAWAERTKQGDYPDLHVELGRIANAKGGLQPSKQVAEVGADGTEEAPRTYDFHFRAEDYTLNGRVGNYLRIRNHFDPGTAAIAASDYPDLHIVKVELFAPYYKVWPPESRTRILIDSKSRNDEKAYAGEVIEAFMRRAYRRPVTADEVKRMTDLFAKLRPNADTFDAAITDTLSAVLSSPGFLLLAEPAPTGAPAEKVRKLNDYELASRLSYFLWSTMPDATLFDLAARGKLQDDGVLREQVKRMLADPRSNQFSERFVSQWLDLDSARRVAVNPEYFPNFDDKLKPAMRQETVYFFDAVLREDRSSLALLDSDFAMLNAGLAKHYGIAGVAGDHFRKVPLKPENHRGGLLTHAGILLGNSSGDDTHPVKRGVWVLERLLNAPPPPPPPEVPTLTQSDKTGVRLSLTEKLLVHRQEAACMNCHKKIDPWGLAFENYDGVGAWRDTVKVPAPAVPKKKGLAAPALRAAGEVDAKTELPDGTKIDGLAELKKYLLTEKRDRFAETLVSKTLSYAIWRNLEFSDRQAVQELSQSFRKGDYKLRGLVAEIVLSETFRTK